MFLLREHAVDQNRLNIYCNACGPKTGSLSRTRSTTTLALDSRRTQSYWQKRRLSWLGRRQATVRDLSVGRPRNIVSTVGLPYVLCSPNDSVELIIDRHTLLDSPSSEYNFPSFHNATDRKPLWPTQRLRHTHIYHHQRFRTVFHPIPVASIYLPAGLQITVMELNNRVLIAQWKSKCRWFTTRCEQILTFTSKPAFSPSLITSLAQCLRTLPYPLATQ